MRGALLKIGLIFFIMASIVCLIGFLFGTVFDDFVDTPGALPERTLIGWRTHFAGFMLSFVGYVACLILLVRGPKRRVSNS